jgi:phosphotransferase system HPr (HPr) family protein
MPSIELLVNHSVGFVKTANKFQCEIMIRNLTTDGKFVNAKSILSVLTLGVNQGHKIFVEAEGEQAEEALTALNDLVNNNFGESTG